MISESRELQKMHEGFRFFSYLLLFLTLYLNQVQFFREKGIYIAEFSDVLAKLNRLEFIAQAGYSKTLCLVFLAITCIGTKAKKERDLKVSALVSQIVSGLIIYWGSLYFYERHVPIYLGLSFFGFVILNIGFDNISKLINVNLMKDRFNEENESFPQEKTFKSNEFSVNLATLYQYKRKWHEGWINIVNPFRGSIVIGTPGSGKSYSVVLPFIRQHLSKGFSMCVYDFKYPDLSEITYNHFLRARRKGTLPKSARFYVINFDNIRKSYRCNPLSPELMESPIDAFESPRTVLYNLNREWIRKQGEFFSESAVSFFAAVIWFLKRYRDGEFCTLPHAIELLQLDYDELFEVLSREKDVENIINPFINAHKRGAHEQLEGQLGSLKIAISKIVSREIYWICSGNDFSLDINNPKHTKVVCLANNPLRIEMYGAVLSLFITRMLKVINRKNQHKSSLIFDELPTIYFRGLDTLIATARSNKISTLLGIQTVDQLIRDYGKEQANAILTNIGNIFSGQVVGETAKTLSERFGKVLQKRQSMTINRQDKSTSINTQMDTLIPASKISNLTQGIFVGAVSDNFEERIEQKIFHAEIVVDNEKVKKETKKYQPIPIITNFTDEDGKNHLQEEIEYNYRRIKDEAAQIIVDELERIKKEL